MNYDPKDSHCKICKYKNSKVCETECKNRSSYVRRESRNWYESSIEEAASNARMRVSRQPYTPGRNKG